MEGYNDIEGTDIDGRRVNGVVLDPGSSPLPDTENISYWKLFKKHKVSVIVDCLVFGIFGMGVAFLGPTLFDLGCQTKSPLKQMNWVFFVQLLMTMIGSISAGYMAGRLVPAPVLLCVGMTGLPVTMFLIPTCTGLPALLINLMVMGWFMGCVDCIANLRMIMRFGTNVAPFLQAMHFTYGLGAFVSPMIASPFLLNIDCTPFIDGYTVVPDNGTQQNETALTIAPQPAIVKRAVHLSHSEAAFFILGGLQLMITIFVYAVMIMEKRWGVFYGPPSTSSSFQGALEEAQKDESNFTEYSGSRLLTRCMRCGSRDIVLITALASASLFIYDGIQSSYADYIYSYAEKNVDDLAPKEGAWLNSGFWGTFAFGRLLAVGLSTKLSAAFMLLTNLSGCTFALLLTLIWHSSRVAVFIGTCAIGLFLSSMSPTVMALAEQYLDVNAPITATMVVCAALGETICPVIVGNLFVSVGPVSFIAFCFSIVLVALILYACLYMVGRDTQKYREIVGASFVWLSNIKHRRHGGESMQINSTSAKYYNHDDADPDDEINATDADGRYDTNDVTSAASHDSGYR